MVKPYIPGGIALKHINNQKGSAMFWGLMLMFIGTIIIAGIAYVGDLGVYVLKPKPQRCRKLWLQRIRCERWVDLR